MNHLIFKTKNQKSIASSLWGSLTIQPLKAELYSLDFVADDAMDDLQWVYGSEWRTFLREYTFLLLKPDALSRRCGGRVLDYVEAHGFSPVAIRRVLIDKNVGAQLWRHQWNAASLDRVRLANALHSRSYSLVIFLRYADFVNLPASVALCSMKGPTHAELRTPAQLRSILGMRNRMLGFIHTPDEPADVLRESGILFDSVERRKFFEEIKTSGKLGAAIENGYLDDIERNSDAHSIDFQEVFDRQNDATKDRINSLLAARNEGLIFRLEEIQGTLEEVGGNLVFWDFVTIAAELISFDKPGAKPIIDAKAFADAPLHWRNWSTT